RPPRFLGRRALGEPLVAGTATAVRGAGGGRPRRGRGVTTHVQTSRMIETQERTVSVWQDRVRIRVLSKGRGPALVFFHGPWGLTWDPFLDELAQSFTVLSPEHLGTTPDAHDDIYHLDGPWDLVLCYDELLATLGIGDAAFVDHSFAGIL